MDFSQKVPLILWWIFFVGLFVEFFMLDYIGLRDVVLWFGAIGIKNI